MWQTDCDVVVAVASGLCVSASEAAGREQMRKWRREGLGYEWNAEVGLIGTSARRRMEWKMEDSEVRVRVGPECAAWAS